MTLYLTDYNVETSLFIFNWEVLFCLSSLTILCYASIMPNCHRQEYAMTYFVINKEPTLKLTILLS